MRSVFTTLASSRFVDREAVIEALCSLAQHLSARHDEIVAVYLFGSFATGMATPRSDADILVELASDDPVLRERLMEAAQLIFLEAPVPVEVFALGSMRLKEGRGVAGAVAREGLRLA